MRTYNCTRFSRLGELACIDLNLCCTVLMNWEMLLVFDLFCRGVEISLQCALWNWEIGCVYLFFWFSSHWLNSQCRWTESSFLSVISRHHHEQNLLIVISRRMVLVSVINLKRRLSFFLLPNIPVSFSLLISLRLLSLK